MMAQLKMPGSNTILALNETTVDATVALKAQTDDLQALEVTITSLLQHLRIPAHIKGYHYLRKAILLEVESEEIGGTSAKVLFPKVAKHFGATADKVDRGIRYALAIAWKQCDFAGLPEVYGFTVHFSCWKPTNLEFIACVADYYKLQTLG